jgi:COP9 signalosome complex subunit 6
LRIVLANLTAKANAIRMLHARIRLLKNYLELPVTGEPNHQILRALKSLTHSRLALLTPADAAAFRQEQLAEQSDVHLVALLGVLTRSIEEARSVGKKFSAIEKSNRSNLKAPNIPSDTISWEGYGAVKDLRRRGHRDGGGVGGVGGYGPYGGAGF